MKRDVRLATVRAMSWGGRSRAAIVVVALTAGAVGLVPSSSGAAAPAPAETRNTVEPTLQVYGDYQPVVGDFDGNGFDDILWYSPGAGSDTIWYSGAHHSHTDVEVDTPEGDLIPLVADFNGDGRSDILWYDVTGAHSTLWTSGPHRSFLARPFAAVGGGYLPVAGDFDGDGHADILWYGPGAIHDFVWYGNGDGTFDWRGIGIDGNYEPLAGDFNGDGRTDVLFYGAGTAPDVLAYGTTTRWVFSSHDITQDATFVPVVGDYDGDGRADIAWYGDGAQLDQLWFATATTATFHTVVTNVPASSLRPFAGRFDGGTRSEIFWYAPGLASDLIWRDVPVDAAASTPPSLVTELPTALNSQFLLGNGGVAVDASGDIYVAGNTYQQLPGTTDTYHGRLDGYVAKYDTIGHLLWLHILGTVGDDSVSALALGPHGDVYIAGTTDGDLPLNQHPNLGDAAAFTAKYDSSGTLLWLDELGTAEHPGGDDAEGLAVDADGNAYTSGTTGTLLDGVHGHEPTDNGGDDAFLASYDSDGHRRWVQQTLSPQLDGLASVAVDRRGAPYLVFGQWGLGAGRHVQHPVVMKYSPSGRTEWVLHITAIPSSWPAAVTAQRSGGVVICSNALENRYATPDLSWVGADGHVRSATHVVSGVGADCGAMTSDRAGHVILSGSTAGRAGAPELNAGGGDVYVSELDTHGDTVASQLLGTNGDDTPSGVALDGKGRVFVSGSAFGQLPGAPPVPGPTQFMNFVGRYDRLG